MKIELVIDEDVNELINSWEKFVKLARDLKYLTELPPFKIERGKFGKNVKVNYKKRYRKIRVKRDFDMIKVTEDIEKERGWKKGLYNYTSVKSDSLEYFVSDSIETKNLDKNLEGKQEIRRRSVDIEFYTEKELEDMLKSLD